MRFGTGGAHVEPLWGDVDGLVEQGCTASYIVSVGELNLDVDLVEGLVPTVRGCNLNRDFLSLLNFLCQA